MLSSRVGSRIDYSKLSSLVGLNRNKLKDYLHLLEYTYFIQTATPFTSGLGKELSKQPKLYFADTGLLQVIGQLSGGQVFENAIANQLARLGKVQYYQRTNGPEIDFVLNQQTAIEVKETCTPHDLMTVRERSKSIGLSESWLAGRFQPASGFDQFVWGGSIF